jgi:DNA-binding protein HU-beta
LLLHRYDKAWLSYLCQGEVEQDFQVRIVNGRIDKKALTKLVITRTGKDSDTVEEILDATLEEIYEALKRGECVSLRNFGTFYIREGRSSWVFRFNPSQRLRKLFGWASTYKGKL